MGYEKKRNMELVSKEDCEMAWKWEPLLESNGAGYFTRQEHVTPFVGFTGRLYGLTTEEYESFMVPPPDTATVNWELVTVNTAPALAFGARIVPIG